MTESHSAVIERLSAEFAAMSEQMAKVSAELTGLDRVLTSAAGQPAATSQPATPQPAAPAVSQQPPQPQPPSAQAYWPQAPVAWPSQQWQPVNPPAYQAGQGGYPGRPAHAGHQPYVPQPPAPTRAAQPARAPQAVPGPAAAPPVHPRPAKPSDGGWIGKVLAVAGVGVTLIGVVLLVVLAAQAGILRPEIRVVAGAALAGGLVAVAARLYSRPGGRVGAVALASTGIAAAYIDVLAVTTIYAWLPALAGLVIAALIGGAGLLLARRWDSQALGLLVFVPLTVLAPVVTDGVTMLLVAFMLVLAAATLPFQFGKDWTVLHAARVAAPTLPILLATVRAAVSSDVDAWLLGGAALIAAMLAIMAALVLLPRSTNRVAIALITAAGTTPVLVTPAALSDIAAALLCAALSLTLLAVVLVSDRLTGVAGAVAQIWSTLSAVAALIAVLAAFEGDVAAPVLFAMAVTLAVAGGRSGVARWSSVAFAGVGGLIYLAYAPPQMLVDPWEIVGTEGVSILIASVLLAAWAVVSVWMWSARGRVDAELTKVIWVIGAAVVVYAVTTFTVTAGVLAGGIEGGFLAGHMAATICWIAMAAGLFAFAARGHREARSMPIAGGLALTVAAMAKLFLFDLGTLSGIFRVVVFIVVGLVLLGMGAGYARLLAQQDQAREGQPVGGVSGESQAAQGSDASPIVTDETRPS